MIRHCKTICKYGLFEFVIIRTRISKEPRIEGTGRLKSFISPDPMTQTLTFLTDER